MSNKNIYDLNKLIKKKLHQIAIVINYMVYHLYYVQYFIEIKMYILS